jgi:hypothetical protein
MRNFGIGRGGNPDIGTRMNSKQPEHPRHGLHMLRLLCVVQHEQHATAGQQAARQGTGERLDAPSAPPALSRLYVGERITSPQSDRLLVALEGGRHVPAGVHGVGVVSRPPARARPRRRVQSEYVWHGGGVTGGRGILVGSAAGRDHAGFVGEHDRLNAVAQAELGQDAGDVRLHRCLGQVH